MSYPPLPPIAKAFIGAVRSPDMASLNSLLHDGVVVIDGEQEIRGRSAVESWLNRRRSEAVRGDRIINRRLGTDGLVITALPQSDRGVAIDDPFDWIIRIEDGVIRRVEIARHLGPPLPAPVESFVRAVNRSDAEALFDLFSGDALVNDELVDYWNADNIREWIIRDIIGKRLALFVVDCIRRNDRVVLTCHATGDFDVHGLPDPLVLSLYISANATTIDQLIILQKPLLD